MVSKKEKKKERAAKVREGKGARLAQCTVLPALFLAGAQIGGPSGPVPPNAEPSGSGGRERSPWFRGVFLREGLAPRARALARS